MSDSDVSSVASDASVTPALGYHPAVHCHSCRKESFSGPNYKCLHCYDYNMCAVCYDHKAFRVPHSADHPLQCLLTPTEFEQFYGAEDLDNPPEPQSYTCSYCSRMGFTRSTLYTHVYIEHPNPRSEGFEWVLCPICASLPTGRPNFMTDDLMYHLHFDHECNLRSGILDPGAVSDDEGGDVEVASGIGLIANPSFETVPELGWETVPGPSSDAVVDDDEEESSEDRPRKVRFSLDRSSFHSNRDE